MSGIGTGSVNMGVPAQIVDIRQRLDLLYNLSVRINTTVTTINSTVNNIYSIVQVINTTTNETNTIVKLINSTTTSILNKTNIILNNTNIILNDTTYIKDLLNCNGSTDSPICDKIQSLNTTIQQLLNLTIELNTTAHNINITIGDINVTGVNVTVNVDFTNLTSKLKEIKGYINCTNVTGYPNTSVCIRLERIENLTAIINSSLNSIYNTTIYWNTTVFGNLTLEDIFNAISNITVNTSDVLESIRGIKEFQQEVIFLITDSFNLQQEAGSDFGRGDFSSAADKLVQSNSKLTESMDLILAEQQKIQANTTNSTSSFEFSTKWVVAAMLIIISTVAVLYLFGKEHEEGADK
jgi:hypothetical protein